MENFTRQTVAADQILYHEVRVVFNCLNDSNNNYDTSVIFVKYVTNKN